MQENKKHIVIAIDGPAGAGKSTVAKIIAQKMNLLYIDTGAMYRAITYVVYKLGINPKDEKKVSEVLKSINLEFKMNKKNNIDVFYNGENINKFLRIKEVDDTVSYVCSYKKVREFMVAKQRELSKNYNVILDGRDIGTVVFPNTPYKFYLDASVEERARRRMLDTKNKERLSFEKVKENIIKRDKLDSTRKLSPLRKAEDAIYIDSTNMSIGEVVNFIIKKVKEI